MKAHPTGNFIPIVSQQNFFQSSFPWQSWQWMAITIAFSWDRRVIDVIPMFRTTVAGLCVWWEWRGGRLTQTVGKKMSECRAATRNLRDQARCETWHALVRMTALRKRTSRCNAYAWATREKMSACVFRAWCGVLFTPSHRLQKSRENSFPFWNWFWRRAFELWDVVNRITPSLCHSKRNHCGNDFIWVWWEDSQTIPNKIIDYWICHEWKNFVVRMSAICCLVWAYFTENSW